MHSETVRYKGVTFRRYPEADKWADRMYFTPGISAKQRGVDRLHREIWKEHYGEIPTGHEVHHKDGDPLNNDISNLECRESLDHQKHQHSHPGAGIQHMERIRPLAAAWHGSAEGREWHSENAKQAWKKRQPIKKICDQCGKEFDSIQRKETDRFCSNACRAAWRRASGEDDEQRTCEACGSVFTVNRYAKTRTCLRKCAWTLRRRA